MTCKEFIDFLMDYIEERLPDRMRAEFEGHIGKCPACLHYLESYRTTVRLGKHVCKDEESVPGDAPEQLVQAILAAVKKG